MSRLALSLLLLVLAPAALAQTDPIKDFQFVGASPNYVTGDTGVLDMSRECQQVWVESRMCTSEEVMNTVSMPASHQDDAWVRPVFAPIARGGSTNTTYASDVSAPVSDGTRPGDFACYGWRVASTSALVVSPEGGFGLASCDVERPVACCALIPVPEPPNVVLRGVGTAGLASLAMFKKKPRDEFLAATAGITAIVLGVAFVRRSGRIS